MRVVFTLGLLFIFSASFAQRIKYYDKNWGLVNYKRNAHYYTETDHKTSVEGTSKAYLMDGTLLSEITYSNLYFKKKTGPFTYFYPDGRIKSQGTFKNDVLDGAFKTYYPNQRLKRAELFENGKLTQGRCFSTTGRDTAYFAYQISPEFPGGQKALETHIKTWIPNAYYSKKGDKVDVVIKFTITPTGETTDHSPIYFDKPQQAEEVIKVIKAMPNWQPAMDDGVKIDHKFMIPVSYRN